VDAFCSRTAENGESFLEVYFTIWNRLFDKVRSCLTAPPSIINIWDEHNISENKELSAKELSIQITKYKLLLSPELSYMDTPNHPKQFITLNRNKLTSVYIIIIL
jgi:hypothetical protein